MRLIFASKLALKKAFGQRPYIPWRAVVDIFWEPEPPPERYISPRTLEENSDGMVCLQFDDKKVYYPQRASLRYIGSEYYQLTTPTHPAFYEKNNTFVSEGDVVLDCGACEGFFSLNVIDRASVIHAFEPVAEVARCLRKTLSVHSRCLVRVWEKALGNSNGTCLVKPDHGDFQGSHVVDVTADEGPAVIPVQMTTIDEFVQEYRIERLDFIKIDVEGEDVAVLEGARNSISQFLPKIAVATYHKPEHAYQIMHLIRDISPLYRIRFAGTANAWRACRPLMAHLYVPSVVRQNILTNLKQSV